MNTSLSRRAEMVEERFEEFLTYEKPKRGRYVALTAVLTVPTGFFLGYFMPSETPNYTPEQSIHLVDRSRYETPIKKMLQPVHLVDWSRINIETMDTFTELDLYAFSPSQEGDKIMYKFELVKMTDETYRSIIENLAGNDDYFWIPDLEGTLRSQYYSKGIQAAPVVRREDSTPPQQLRDWAAVHGISIDDIMPVISIDDPAYLLFTEKIDIPIGDTND